MADAHRALRKRGTRRTTPRVDPTPEPARSGLDLLKAGANWLVRPTGHHNVRSRAFAAGLATEPDTDIVVVDLPRSIGSSDLETLAEVLPTAALRFRLIFGYPLVVDDVDEPGQWLADRLHKPVTLADGDLQPAAGGRLFIPVGHGSGWLGYRPAGPTSHMSRRFPRTVWESPILTDQEWAVSAATVVEPTASGVWVRPVLDENLLETHRTAIAAGVDVPHEVLAVVLGVPGGHTVDPADVMAFWQSQTRKTRSSIRFFAEDLAEVPVRDVLAWADSGTSAPDDASQSVQTAGAYPSEGVAAYSTVAHESGEPARSKASGAALLLEYGLLSEPLDFYEHDERFVEHLLLERPELVRGGWGDSSLAEMVLLRIFLTRPHRIRTPDEADMQSLRGFLSNALARLPSYRGEVNVQADLRGKTLGGEYSRGHIFTETDPLPAYLNGQAPPPDLTSFSIWSESAHRTALVQPDVPDRLMFRPGSCFKVLDHLDDGRVVLLRELGRERRVEGSAGPDRQVRDALVRSHRARLRDGTVGARWHDLSHPIDRAPGLGPGRA